MTSEMYQVDIVHDGEGEEKAMESSLMLHLKHYIRSPNRGRLKIRYIWNISTGLIGFSCVSRISCDWELEHSLASPFSALPKSNLLGNLKMGTCTCVALPANRWDWLPLQNGRLTRCWGRPHRWQPPSWGRPPPGSWRRGGSDQSSHHWSSFEQCGSYSSCPVVKVVKALKVVISCELNPGVQLLSLFNWKSMLGGRDSIASPGKLNRAFV